MGARAGAVEDEYIAAPPVRRELPGLSPELARVLRRREAYAGAREDLERARADVWARFAARGLTL